MSDHAPPPIAARRSARRSVVAVFALLMASAAIAEVLLAAFAPELGMRRYDQRFTGSHPIAANERGFRGPIPDQDQARIVLCLGDSATYGTGVDAAKTWPILLGVSSSEDSSVAGINAALPATDLDQLTRSLDEIWPDQQPAAVVVALTGNMVSLAWIRKAETLPIRPSAPGSSHDSKLSLQQRAKYLPYDSALVGGVLWIAETIGYAFGVNHHRIDPASPYGALLAHGWSQGGLSGSLAADAWCELGKDLARLRDRCASRGIPLFATWIPSRFTISDGIRDNLKFVPRNRLSIDANARCQKLCESLGVTYIDSVAAMRHRRSLLESQGLSSPLYVFGDYTHLDPDGHAAVADAVRSALESMTIRESARAN